MYTCPRCGRRFADWLVEEFGKRFVCSCGTALVVCDGGTLVEEVDTDSQDD